MSFWPPSANSNLRGSWESEGTTPTNPASATVCGWLAGNSRSTRMSPSGTPLKFSELGDSRIRRNRFRGCLGVRAIVWAQNRLAGKRGFEVWGQVGCCAQLAKEIAAGIVSATVRLSSRA
jgi:hypothetical protein